MILSRLDDVSDKRVFGWRGEPIPKMAQSVGHPNESPDSGAFLFETGNLGDHKSGGGGVWEARVNFGPGYRIYFGKEGEHLVILLGGSSKKGQPGAIGAAKKAWAVYKRAKPEAG